MRTTSKKMPHPLARKVRRLTAENDVLRIRMNACETRLASVENGVVDAKRIADDARTVARLNNHWLAENVPSGEDT